MNSDDGDDGDDGEEKRSFEERLQNMLDTPLFDPEQESAGDEPKFLTDFKELFKADQQMGETVFVGLYFALLLSFAQFGVRVYKHCYFMPDKECPFVSGPSVDDIFSSF